MLTIAFEVLCAVVYLVLAVSSIGLIIVGIRDREPDVALAGFFLTAICIGIGLLVAMAVTT
jgi:choline-glycine betaine transporter